MKITRFDPNQGDPAIPITGSGSSSSSIAAHLADAIDAHDASAISIVDAGGFYTGTDVEAALQEAEQDIADHLADAIDAHDASAVSIVDAGAYFAAADVEAALQELGAVVGSGASNSVSAETTFGISPAAGAATTFSRGDHTHGSPPTSAISALGFVGEILISDTPSTPLVFADLLQNEAQDDLVYADL